MTFEPVIGLEVHVQAKTKTKLFCGCAIEFGEQQNSNICPVCTGQPGALPVINREAVRLAIKAALATNCKINLKSIFARKNYFYPDLPKGYQISQFEQPFCEHGHVEITLSDGSAKKIGLTRIHMEEDAGKNVHQGADGILGSDYSLVDLNRACTPLLEIVSEPDMRSVEDARLFLDQLKLTMQYAGVSDADMEKGQLRVDVNVSLREQGAKEYGVRAEIKNMNSFRNIERAIKYEIVRQTEVLENGGEVVQETRNFDDASGTTTSLRSKEESHDYRYFPEPDLLPLEVSEEWIESVKSEMPELPKNLKEKYSKFKDLNNYDINVVVNNQTYSGVFNGGIKTTDDVKTLHSMITTDFAGHLKNEAIEKKVSKLEKPNDLKELGKKFGLIVNLIKNGRISSKIAKTVLEELLREMTPETIPDPEEIVRNSGMTQIANPDELKPVINAILSANPAQVQQYKSGEQKVLGFFVGQVMKETKGRANP
ncbi:Asp-tRNA(Asn)/Glu-tRNA(Gln) amidotransferase subunit GatB, partial [Candidatus Margulisiibacteriota bacterium]